MRVIAQLRFPLLLSVEERAFAAQFQEAIRAEYPVLTEGRTLRRIPGGLAGGPAEQQALWQFSNARETWRLSLAPDFLALETTSYCGRNEFIDRLFHATEVLRAQIAPELIQRFGVRYVNRLTGQELLDLGKLIRPEALGLPATVVSRHIQHAVSETLLNIPDADEQLLLRSGIIPAGATPDPAVLEPIHEQGWILDLDIFSSKPYEFSSDETIRRARRYIERVYAVFRWTVTDEFLRRYGGQP